MLKQAHYTIIILLFWSSFFYGQECTGGITSYPYTQGFENTFGSWTQSATDDLDWSLLSGATPSSNTGPSAAYAGSYYIYVEASGNGTGYPNKRAIITSPCYDLSVLSYASFNFYYHMYGSANMGTIALEISTDDGGSWTSIWSQSGNLGNQWNPQVSIDLSTYIGGSVQFRFNRFTDSTWQADIAIDNVSITGTEIPTPDGYLGPGGVGHTDGTSDLELWLMADKDVASNGSSVVTGWLDNSGNGNDVSTIGGDPTYSATINGYEVISLDGTDHFLSNVASNTSTKASTYVAATITGDNDGANGWGGVLSGSKSGQLDWDNTDHVVFLSRNGDTSNLCAQRDGTKSSFTDGIVPNSNVKIMGSEFNGSNSIVRFNGSAAAAVTSSDAFNFNLIGIGKRITESKYTIGNYGEVIYFSKEINLAKKIIIENYLQAKYDGTIDASIDFYDEDTSGENFDHKVAGIGQASDGSNHTDSQGTGIVRINTPSALSNGDFLFWGEDVKDATYEYASSTDYLERLNTKWRVSKVGDLGTVSLSFKDSDIDLSGYNCGDLNLIVSNSSTFATKTSYTLTLSAGIYTATEVNFTDGDYFTIEYRDLIVVDGTQFYNGSNPISNVPNTTDDCFKLLVKSTATGALTLTEDADVREIEIESGGILSVDSGMRLQVTNGIINNGDIRLVGTSQLVQTHTTVANLNSGTGNLHVDQTATTASVYHSGYWSSPVRKSGTAAGTPFSINDVLKDGSVPTAATATVGEAAAINFISGYDGSSATTPIEISTRWLATLNNASDWTRYVSPTAAVLTPGLGWNMKSVGSTFTFKGIPNDGDYAFDIDAGKLSLIGNPYPSALDAQAFINDPDNVGEFTGLLYVYNSASDASHIRGDYTGTYSVIMSDVDVAAGRYLPIGQAFFITKEGTGTGTVTFKNEHRTLTTLSDTGALVAKTKSKVDYDNTGLPLIKIGLNFLISKTERRKRQVAVVFRGLTNNYDERFDAEMWAKQPIDMYLKVDDREGPFIITGIESFKKSIEIPLMVDLAVNKNLTFNLDEIKNIDSKVYLLDKLTNTYYNLSEGAQAINLEKGEYTDRFYIVFEQTTLSTEGVSLVDSFQVAYNRSKKELVISNYSNEIIKKVSIYNILGQKILKEDSKDLLENKEIVIDTKKLKSALNIVLIETENGIISKKIL